MSTCKPASCIKHTHYSVLTKVRHSYKVNTECQHDHVYDANMMPKADAEAVPSLYTME